MEIGAVISEAWSLYRKHWRHLIPIALIVFVVTAGLTAAAIQSGEILNIVLASIISVVGSFWLQGALVRAVEDIRDGKADMSIGQTFASVRRYLGRIGVAGLLAGIGIGFGLLLLVVPGLILMTMWIFVVPVIVIEDRGIRDSFSRSTAMTRDSRWNVFGLIAVTFLIALAFGLLFGIFIAPLDEATRRFVGDLVGGTLIGPFMTTAWTVAYFHMRAREAGDGWAGDGPTL